MTTIRPAPSGEEASKSRRKTWYFSSPHQLDRLLSILDRTEYEKALCQELVNLRPEILRQMAITVSLTSELKGKNQKSYLEVEEETAKQAAIKEEEEDVEVDTETVQSMETDEVVKTESPVDKVEAKEEEVVEECGVEVDDDDFDEACLQLSFKDAYEDIEDNDNNSDEDDSTSESTCLFWDTVGVVVVRGSTISIIALKLLFELMLRDFFKGIVKY